MAALRGWLGMADFTTPFRFLDALLSVPLDGRRQLYRRLGREARDPIDELLGQALAFQRRQAPLLIGVFAHYADSTTEIKRPNEENGTPSCSERRRTNVKLQWAAVPIKKKKN